MSKNEKDSDVVKSFTKDEIIKVDKLPRTKPFITLVACCAALGGLVFGYDIGGAGGTFQMDGFQYHFDWSCEPGDSSCVPKSESEIASEKGMINAFFGIGAMIGAILNTYFADKLGRLKSLVISNLFFILGASMQAGAPDMNVMWIGRIFSGMGIGMLSMVVPVYIAECSPEHLRGRLGTLWQLAVTVGILVASACNIGLEKWSEGWRISYGGNIIFSIMLLIALIWMPESPRWLAANGTQEQLLQVLKKLRYEEDIEGELLELREEAEEEKREGVASWKDLFSSENKMRYRVLLGISLQLFQQFCGINAIMFYAPDILAEFFSPDASIVGAFVLNTINFFATFITLWAIDKFGRIRLLVSGGFIMLFSLIVNAILSSLPGSVKVGYSVVTFSAFFIIAFAYSWGPVVWVVCSEIFPIRARGKATGLTTSANWIATTVVGAVFPAAQAKSLSGCFIFFAVMISIGITVVHLFAVETANRTILEIDEKFATHKVVFWRWGTVEPEDKRPLEYSSVYVSSERATQLSLSAKLETAN
jgi:sugar porter (SP) family MFS transporter